MAEDARPPVVSTLLVFGEVAVLRAQALSSGVDLCGDGAEVALQGLRPPMNGASSKHVVASSTQCKVKAMESEIQRRDMTHLVAQKHQSREAEMYYNEIFSGATKAIYVW